MNEPPVPAVDPGFPQLLCQKCVQRSCKHRSSQRLPPKTPPRRECLPDLNVTPLLAKSHHNPVLMDTHSACKRRLNVGKEGVPMFRELKELLNALTDTSNLEWVSSYTKNIILNENPFYPVCALGPHRSTSGGCHPTFAGAIGVGAFPSCSISDNNIGSVTGNVANVCGSNLAHPTKLRSPHPTSIGRSSCTSHSPQCSSLLDRPNDCHSFADDIADRDSADCLVCECKGTKSTSVTGSQGGGVTNNDHIYKAPFPSNGDVISDDVKVEGPLWSNP